MRRARGTRLAILLISLLLGCFGHGFARAQEPQEAGTNEGHTWAILIGVEKYQHLNPLHYTINDVKQLEDTLHERGGVERLRAMTDDADDAEWRPLRSSLMAAIPEFLKRPGPNDRLILYFSGHGVRDSKGTLYLAPIDCDPKDLASTGISVAWLRDQLAGCKASLKLLVLDACHAGSEKGEDQPPAVSANELARPFVDLSGVVTFASSTGDERSQIWDDKKQSLYSYWLNQGLKGHADKDGDGAIEMDELNEYVFRCVTRTATARFQHPQTPVRIMHPTPGNPVLVQLRPQTLTGLLNDMADQLAYTIEEQRLGKIGVLEFSTLRGVEKRLGAHFGILGNYCADELEARLMSLGAGKFSVVQRDKLQSALESQDFQVKDLGSSQALRSLSSRIDGGLSVLVQGLLRSRNGGEVTLQCKLIQTDKDVQAGSVGGKALLNVSERSMLADSFPITTQDRRPVFEPGKPPKPIDEQVIARVDERSQGPHPLSDPRFPFPVRIMVGGRERPGICRGNKWLVPVKKGEIFEIHVENRANRLVCMRLLVDGLNWLPEVGERLEDKGLRAFVWGKHVSLEKARYSVLDPAVARVFAIRGFAIETGKEGRLREFLVSDVRGSLAGRRGFTNQAGLITVAFYEPTGTQNRHVGVGIGEERRENLEERDVMIGDQLAVVNLQLVDADEVGVNVP